MDALCGPSDGHHDFAGGSCGAGRGEEHGDDEDLHDDVAMLVRLTVLGEDVLKTDAMLASEVPFICLMMLSYCHLSLTLLDIVSDLTSNALYVYIVNLILNRIFQKGKVVVPSGPKVPLY